jgi:hypothetical protein
VRLLSPGVCTFPGDSVTLISPPVPQAVAVWSEGTLIKNLTDLLGCNVQGQRM